MFDFGHVLVHFDTSRWYDFIGVHQCSRDVKPDEFFSFDHVAAYERGLLDKTGYFRAVQEVYELNVGIDTFFKELTDIMNPDQKIVRLKQVLKRNGVKLALTSNINRCHFEYVSQKWPEVFRDFDYLALSFRLQARKPDLKMYRVPALQLGVQPEGCFLVDDYEPNVFAFRDWGGTGYHYNVVDETFCPNGRLDIERMGLIFKLASLGLISFSQAGDII